MTTRDDIRSWLLQRRPDDATHMIVAVDTFDHGNYPVYVKPGQSAQAEVDRLKAASMTRVMEVYRYDLPIEDQLREHRAWHI